MLRIILTVNTDYFPKHHQSADLYNADTFVLHEVGTEFLSGL